MTDILVRQFRLETIQQRCQYAAHIALLLLFACIPLSTSGTDICLLVAVICSLCAGSIKQRYTNAINSPACWGAIALTMLMLLGMSWSTAPWHYQIVSLHKYSKLLFIPLLMPLFDHKVRQQCLNAFLLAMIVVVLLCIAKYIGVIDIGYRPDAGSLFRNHILTSYFVAVAAYIFAYRFFSNHAYRKLNLALFLLCSYQEFFINTGRTGYLVYFALMLVLATQLFRMRGLLLCVLAAVLVSCGLYFTSSNFHKRVVLGWNAVQSYAHDKTTSVGFRISFAKFSIDKIKQQPLLGYGTGSFSPQYYASKEIAGWHKRLDTPHNDFLLITFQYGLIGLIIFLTYYLLVWRQLLGINDKNIRHLGYAIVISFIIAANCDALLYLNASGYFLVAMLALCLSVTTEDKTNAN